MAVTTGESNGTVTLTDNNKFTMPDSDVTVTATFSAKSDISYTITYKFQTTAGGENYSEEKPSGASGFTESGTGSFNQTVTIATPEIEGFELVTGQSTSQTIGASNNNWEIKYNRKSISLTFELGGGTTTTTLSEGNKLTGLYGANVEIAEPTKKDHAFTSWNPEKPATFPAEDKTYTAQYEEITLTVKTGETEISEDGYTWSAPEGEGEDTLTLTAETITGATVAWSVKSNDSSDSEVVQINDSGVLSFKEGKSRPTDADVTVKVTATATKGNGSTSKEISIVIKKTEAPANGDDNNQSDNSEDDENENDSGAGGENTEGNESNNENDSRTGDENAEGNEGSEGSE